MYIIFDTNVYRDLTYGLNEAEAREKFAKIKTSEATHNITPVLSTVTAMELLAHLAEQSDPAFEACKIAAIVAGCHILRSPGQVSIYPHPQMQLQQLIFNDYDETVMSKFEIIGEIINFLNKGPADDFINEFNDQITEIKRVVGQHEQDFKITMLSVIRGIDPQTTSWIALQTDKTQRQRILKYLIEQEREVLDLLAMGYVHKTVHARNRKLPLQEMAIAAIDVANYFHTALRLHLAIMKKMLIGGFDMDNRKRNRENTIWDIYQLFSVSDSTMNGQEMIFVTADSWLHEISSESCLQAKIMRKEEYLQMLQIDVF
jgi:hypothetical protein